MCDVDSGVWSATVAGRPGPGGAAPRRAGRAARCTLLARARVIHLGAGAVIVTTLGDTTPSERAVTQELTSLLLALSTLLSHMS